jgi:hypothetical protein
MKKILLVLALIPLIIVGVLLGFPEIIINKDNLLWVLQRKEISEELSWDSFEVNVHHQGLIKKEITIEAKNLCGQLNKEVFDLRFCLEKTDIGIFVGMTQWPFVKTSRQAKILFEFIKLNSLPASKIKKDESDDFGIDISETWRDIWILPIPNLELIVPKIELPGKFNISPLSIYLELKKNKVKLKSIGIELNADKKGLSIKLKDQSYIKEFVSQNVEAEIDDIHIDRFQLQANFLRNSVDIKTLFKAHNLLLSMQGKTPSYIDNETLTDSKIIYRYLSDLTIGVEVNNIKKLVSSIPERYIPIEVKELVKKLGGQFNTTLKFKEEKNKIRAIFNIMAMIEHNNKTLSFNFGSTPILTWQWPLKTDPMLKSFILQSRAQLKIDSMKGHLNSGWKNKFDQLPSPLNNFDGPVTAQLKTRELKSSGKVELQLKTDIKLSNGDQKLFIEIEPRVDLDISKKTISKTDLLLNFKEVRLKLPHITLTEAIPQVGPDQRIAYDESPENKQEEIPKDKVSKQNNQEGMDIKIITAPDNPIRLSTNLLNESLYLNLNLVISDGATQGTISLNPLETTIFKRQVQVKETIVTLTPNYSAIVSSEIHFPLPNYRIILKIDGPVDEPRPILSSIPPLPESDIVSVLLFGQPLSALPENEQATAASRSSQMLSQGILSLSVLYFLSDTPIQSIGVDPETQKVSAQIGLGKKSSLQLSAQEDGTQSVGIRRSIGKGWFIDTSVQKSSLDDESDQKNYGVLLERIISY